LAGIDSLLLKHQLHWIMHISLRVFGYEIARVCNVTKHTWNWEFSRRQTCFCGRLSTFVDSWKAVVFAKARCWWMAELFYGMMAVSS